MKASLLDIIIYIFKNYPRIEELSKPRLVKLVYLIDWKSSLEHREQTTDIQWYFNHYGPYVDDIISLIKRTPDVFDVTSYQNPYGGVSDKIVLREITRKSVKLPEQVKSIVDFVIEKTHKLGWSDFISLVYSTYPVKSNSKYTNLNLIESAIEYHKVSSQATITPN